MWQIELRNEFGERLDGRTEVISLQEFNEPEIGPLGAARRLDWGDDVVAKLMSMVPAWLVSGEQESLLGEGDLAVEPERRSPLIALRATPELELPPALVWTDESIVLIEKPEGVTDITFSYEETEFDAERRSYFERREEARPLKYLEWFAVIGPNSALTSGDESLGKRTRIATGSAGGTVVGRVVNVMTPGPDHYRRDVSWGRRLEKLERRAPDLARRVPRLDMTNHSRWLVGRDIDPDDAACLLVVLVHGTVSCGMRMASALLEHSVASTIPDDAILVRFEHDTFHSLHANVISLSNTIQAFRGSAFTFGGDRPRRVKNILLVGHSRGGLVAAETSRTVIGMERGAWPPPRPDDIEVLTFGTPHVGTPLVANISAVGGLVRAFIRVSSRMAAKHLGLDPLGWAVGFMTRFINLPKGIAAMHPDSDFCHFRRTAGYDSPITAFGASFEPTGTRDGFVPSFRKGFLKEVMNGQPNDGVVPTASCIDGRFSETRMLEDCAHSDYFEHDECAEAVWQRIRRSRR